MSRPSATSDQLILLDSPDDFVTHTLSVVRSAKRKIALLSDCLDPYLYNREELTQALSAFARRSKSSELRILVRHTDELIEKGHLLARLHQRLSSKVQLRKIAVEPSNTHMAFLCADTDHVVYKNDDRVYQGFANYAAASEVRSLTEEFNRVWEFAQEDPGLRTLHL
ncbi:DUF7931 domain-containing protein [Gilvimarinus algae]|uniref:DUF7931 domain-containing protein n=1 Tax=Gilvimarinus algae TaxID=3058037 RepID=A0ABT8TIA7_9GAMM|nr:hypothetical protein [Gilvimarinus sp. SDUM040014]MDO3382047.1 hypothetical protein [Gilvimarinus sp. SDUM040014]